MKIFVIPATYNEKDNIEKFITVLEEEVFPRIKDHEMYILVADDYSPDGTGDIIKSLMKKYKNLDMNQGERKGLGAAYLRTMGEAIEKRGADVVIEIDADFQFDPHDIVKFVKKIDEGYDMVIQTRYSGGGSIPENWPLQRKMFSITANLFVRTVFTKFSIHDWTGGFRAIRKEVFLKVRPEMANFGGYIFQIAFLHKAVRDGYKIGEVPLHFSDRKLGSSKIASFSYIMDVLRFVIFTRLKEFERFIKFLIVGGTGFIIQLALQEGSYYTGVASFLAVLLHPLLTVLVHTSDTVAFANGVAAGIGAEGAILFNFTLNNLWTFHDRAHSNIFQTIKRGITFNLTSFGAVIVQFLAIWIGVLAFGPATTIFSFHIPTRDIILVPTIAFIVIPMNYLIYNKIIWKKKK
ncbi:MAG TPA: glycosyltransferase [Patescibacteria group bacterium]|nr:glycosyltransferase [Patescibacteria group bacterium]